MNDERNKLIENENFRPIVVEKYRFNIIDMSCFGNSNMAYKQPPPFTVEIKTLECISHVYLRTREDDVIKNIIWRTEQGKIVKRNAVEIQGLEAGTYSVEMTINHTPVEKTYFIIDVPVTCSLLYYDVIDASGIFAWDGKITAVFDCIPENAEFFWSNGEKTSIPELDSIKPGRYTLTVVSDLHIIFIHKPDAAVVGIS